MFTKNEKYTMPSSERKILSKLIGDILKKDVVIHSNNKSLFFDEYFFLYTDNLVEIQDPNEVVSKNGFSSFLTIYDLKLSKEGKEIVENMFETIQTKKYDERKKHENDLKKKFHEYLNSI